MNEVTITDTALISAPVDAVWAAIENPAEHARWHPYVTQIVGEHEPGQIRECAVLVGRKEGRTRERCVEYERGHRISWAIEEDSTGFGRMVSGWTAGFTLEERDGATTVSAESRFRPRNFAVQAILPVIRRKFHQTQREILGSLETAMARGD
jgi:uncharacterized protein YndB with AHSA1/START domain